MSSQPTSQAEQNVRRSTILMFYILIQKVSVIQRNVFLSSITTYTVFIPPQKVWTYHVFDKS